MERRGEGGEDMRRDVKRSGEERAERRGEYTMRGADRRRVG